MTKDEFITHINKHRKACKNQWYSFIETVDNRRIEIKGFNTWLQIFKIDGIQQNTAIDISVSQFNKQLNEAL